MKTLTLLFFLTFLSINGQIIGCMDTFSKNYNPKAVANDGGCLYKNVKMTSKYSIKLSDSIRETSGLIAFDHLLWTNNDDHDKTIYGLDSLGKIQKKIILENAVNHDWEEISQDSSHIYIGDFGNNYTGNRQDLQILKIDKKSFIEGYPTIETIFFQYEDQTDLSVHKQNSTNFDCEAFIVSKDSIYLFTKEWQSSKTRLYVLPNQSGKQIAKFKDTLDIKGLVTGATYIEEKKLIVLCGYSKLGKPFLYLLYDFKDHDFFSGNKRRVDIGLSFHQIEGITTTDGQHYFLTNEALVRKPVLNVHQQIHYLDLSSILKSYLRK